MLLYKLISMSVQLKKLQFLDNFVDKIVFINCFIYFFFILLSISYLNYISPFNYIINKVIRFSIMVLLLSVFYYILSLHFSNKVNILIFLVYVILAINYYIVRNGGIIVIFSYIIVLKNANIEKYMKLFFFIIFFGILFVLILRLLNILPEISFIHSKFGRDVTRYSFGFSYPNQISHYFYTLTSLYIYIRKNKIKYIEIFIVLILNIGLYFLTWTINSLFSSLLILLLCVFVKVNKNKFLNNFFNFLSNYVFIFGFLIILLLTFLYSINFPYFIELNAHLQGRLFLNYTAIKDIGLSLFGTTKTVTTLEYFYIDSGFINLLITKGVIIFILYMFIYTYFSILCVKRNDKWMSICLIVCAYHSVFDASFELINFSPYIIYFFNLLYNKSNIN